VEPLLRQFENVSADAAGIDLPPLMERRKPDLPSTLPSPAEKIGPAA
jgi:hypothetical protein